MNQPQPPTLTQIAHQMVAQIQQRGHVPVCFLMCQATMRRVIDENMVEVNKRRSVLGRAWHWLRYRKAVVKLEALAGVPVMDAPHLQPGMMFLQSAAAHPGMMPGPVPAQQQAQVGQQNAAAPEFWRKEPVTAPLAADVAQQADIAPSLNDLASSNGERPTASDILMKAMTDADKLAGVVVVRVWQNGSLDMCLNVDSFAAQGVLQRAMVYLMHEG